MSRGGFDLLKLLTFTALVITGGAWLAPFFYNAGRALSEVTAHKTTNGPIDWLGDVCARAGFEAFYIVALVISAGLLFFPWIEFLAVGKRASAPGTVPWQLAISHDRPPAGMSGIDFIWQMFAAFFVTTTLLILSFRFFPFGIATTSLWETIHSFLWHIPLALVLAFAAELFLRGLVFGFARRTWSRWPAIVFTAIYSTLLVAILPLPPFTPPDPESPRAGFQLLDALRISFFHPAKIALLWPFFLSAVCLTYARDRTNSIALSAGAQSAVLLPMFVFGPEKTLSPLLPWVLFIVVLFFHRTTPHDQVSN